MTPRATAAVLLRVVGLWLIIQSALDGFNVVLAHRAGMAGSPSTNWTSYDPTSTQSTTTDFYLHDTYYVFAHSPPAVIRCGLCLAFGLVLIFASKPLARLVAHNVENI